MVKELRGAKALDRVQGKGCAIDGDKLEGRRGRAVRGSGERDPFGQTRDSDPQPMLRFQRNA